MRKESWATESDRTTLIGAMLAGALAITGIGSFYIAQNLADDLVGQVASQPVAASVKPARTVKPASRQQAKPQNIPG
jgi:hypothetical protein